MSTWTDAEIAQGYRDEPTRMCPCEAHHTPEGECPDQCGWCGHIGDPDAQPEGTNDG